MRTAWFWTLTILAAGLSLGLYWLTDVPLGVPGEWVWARHDVTPDLLANALLALAVGAAYLAVIAAGYRRLSRAECTRFESCAWLIALAIVAGGWIWTVQGTGATGPTLGRWPFVLYYPSSSGYFFKARYEEPDARRLLRNYEALMAEGDVLHVGTHPPGLFLFFHGLTGLVDAAPGLASVLNDWQPAAVREAFDVIHENSVRTGKPLLPNDRAVLWLAGLICLGLCTLTVWPLYGFVRHYTDRPASWLCAACWPLVPAIAIFLPKSDVAFACLSMTVGWLWILAWRRNSPWLAGLAAAVWTAGLLCSLAFLPVGLWLALLSLFESWPALRAGRRPEETQRALRTIVPAGIVSLGLLAALSFGGEIPLWKTYWLNYRNHAGFYVQSPRTYGTWLVVNPLELACAAGAPLFLAAAMGIGLAWRRPECRSLLAPCLATLLVWLWLWLSGKNSGEAARLWIFLLPYGTACAASVWMTIRPAPTRRLPWPALMWLICQMLVCFGTVQRLNGFALS